MEISTELLAAYAEGNVSEQERNAVRQYLTDHPDQLETVMMMMDEDYDLELDKDSERKMDHKTIFNQELDVLLDEVMLESHVKNKSFDKDIIPMTAMAAQNTVDNLCAVRCEGLVLRHFGYDISDDILLKESEKEGWLKPQGTALHDIGRLSGKRGLNVSHRYKCRIDDISTALNSNYIVLAVVDAGELTGDLEKEIIEDREQGKKPDHVVIVQSICEQSISIIDTSTTKQMDTHPISQFLDAWNDSLNYLIIISDDDQYDPHPIDLSDVEISEDLIELREAIAENAHEVWAFNRMKEGWSYGPFRDDENKFHPDLVPYNKLNESEKEYDREMAMNTIKLVQKLGWELKKK